MAEPAPQIARSAAHGTARAAAPLALVWAFSAFAFFPVTRTFFHHDDFLHLYDIVSEPALRFIFKMHGFHLLLVTKSVFWATYALAGPNPGAYMWSEFVVHLLNGALLFTIADTLTDRRWLASGCAIAWSTQLLQEGTLNAYSVFGQTLCTAFILWALLRTVRLADGRPLSWAGACGSALAIVAASSCFGVGLGVAVAMPIVAVLTVPPSQARRRAVVAFVAAVPVIASLYLVVEAWNVSMLGAYAASTFAPRDLSSLLAMGALLAHLLAVGAVALSLDGFFRAALYPGAAVVLIVSMVTVLAIVGVRAATVGQRRAFLAMLLLSTAAYATIAAGRIFVGLAPSVIALWPRYHYTATAGLALAIAIAVGGLARRLDGYPSLRGAVFVGWLLAIVITHQFVAPRIDNYDVYRRGVASALEAMRTTVAAAPPGAIVRLENRGFPIGIMMPGIKVEFPGWFALHAVFVNSEFLDGHSIRFVEPDEAIRARGRAGRLGATMLISPDAEAVQAR